MSNNYLDNLNKTLSDSKWLEGLYGSEKAEQISKIKGLFVSVSENNNMSVTDKEAILSQAEAYAKKIEILEAKMAVLLEQIEKNEELIQKKAQEVTKLITDSENYSKTYQDEFNNWVEAAILDVMKDKHIKTDEKKYYIQERIKAFPSKYKDAVTNAINNLKNKENEVNGLIGDMDQLVSERNILDKQYGATKSIYELLNANAQKINKMSSNYTNSDADANVPIYSLNKTDRVQEIFDNQNYVKTAGNSEKVGNTKKEAKDNIKNSIKEKYADQIKKGAVADTDAGGDAWSFDNKAIVALKEAVVAGMLDDLKAAGLSSEEVAEFLYENFKGANIRKNKDTGKIELPYGHLSLEDKANGKTSHAQAGAREFFLSMQSFFNNYNNDYYEKDTWSDIGNTINSNEQIEALGIFVDDGIIEDLATKEPAFTFKEAMYALFNPDTGLFKDSGITYILDDQTGEPKYSIKAAGDKDTAEMYKKLADQIEKAWGVKANTNSNNNDGIDVYEPDMIDPLSFMLGNDQYSLIIDRDKDGTFDSTSEFVGGLDGTSWIEDLMTLDANGNGILQGDELKELKLLRSTYEDNAKTSKDKDDKFLRSETTEIDHGFTTAADLGIEELDFNAFINDKDGSINTELVNKRATDISGNDKVDINKSNVFDFGNELKVNINGKDINIKRQDETEDLMKTIYKGAIGQSFNVKFNKEADVDAILNKNYGEFDNFDVKFNAFFANLSIIKGAKQAAKVAYEAFGKLLEELNAAAQAKVNKADFENKGKEAHAYGFNNYKSQIKDYAQKNNLQYNESVAAGIYMRNATLSIEEIALKCNEVLKKAANNDTDNLATVISALKTCAEKGINFSDEVDTNLILEWIEKGEVKSADDIVNKLKNEYKADEEINYNVKEVNVEYNNPREQEFLNSFTEAVTAKIGENANVLDKEAAIVKALACLCNEQITNDDFNTEGRDASEVADDILKKYENEIFG